MVDLAVSIDSAGPVPYAAAPSLALRGTVVESSGVVVHALTLQAQVRIEPKRRSYSAAEQERLIELFGPVEQWDSSLQPFLWANVAVNLGRFCGATSVELVVPCTYDLVVRWATYLDGLDDGFVPLLVLCSGTVFTIDDGGLRVEPVPWDVEARFRLPVKAVTDVMDSHFPEGAWLRLPRRTLDALARYKARGAMTSWEEAIHSLLGKAAE